MKRRAFLVGTAALLLFAGASRAAADGEPRDVVAAIYRIYAGPKGDYSQVSFDDRRIAAYFTKSLRAAMTAMYARSKKNDEAILDFDPVTDSQDPKVERLSITPESEGVVAATFFSGDLKHVVRYVLRREGGAWRIDDVSGGEADGKWDLRDIIKPGAK